MPLHELQIKRMTAAFQSIDTNHSGKFEREDHNTLTDRASLIRGYAIGSPRHRDLTAYLLSTWNFLQQMDQDGDNAISLAEWLGGLEMIIEVGLADMVITSLVKQTLDLADVDDDGELNQTEYSQSLRDVYQLDLTDAQIADYFTRIDKDQDGKLSREELTSTVRDWLLSTDPNSPGNYLFGLT